MGYTYDSLCVFVQQPLQWLIRLFETPIWENFDFFEDFVFFRQKTVQIHSQTRLNSSQTFPACRERIVAQFPGLAGTATPLEPRRSIKKYIFWWKSWQNLMDADGICIGIPMVILGWRIQNFRQHFFFKLVFEKTKSKNQKSVPTVLNNPLGGYNHKFSASNSLWEPRTKLVNISIENLGYHMHFSSGFGLFSMGTLL